MKRTLSLFLTLVMALSILTSVPVTASAASKSDLTFELNEDGKSYSIEGCKKTASGRLVIPSTYNGKPVTEIGPSAFGDCKKLTAVVIPESINYIRKSAFANCTKLTSITIPDSVESINSTAFWGCGYYKNSSNWKNKVLYIGNHLIEAKKSISGKYTVKAGTKTIAYGSFSECEKLTSVIMPDSVVSVCGDAFANCINLVTVKLSNNIDKICSNTFFCCERLSTVKIPDGVTLIEEVAFYCCEKLSTITIPNSVTLIKEAAFLGCDNLTDIYFNGTKKEWKKIDVLSPNDSLLNAKIHYVCSKPNLKSIENTEYGVKITWGKVSGAEKYNVYRKVKGGSYSKIGTTSKTYYTDKKAKSGKKYYYVVKAVKDSATSASSSSKSILHLADPTLKTPSSTKSGVKLTWSKVTGAEGYMVCRKTGSGSYSKIATVKGSTKVTYTDKTAKKGKKYTYKIKAYKSKTYSAYSNTKTITDKY